jgi:hypothetical protein
LSNSRRWNDGGTTVTKRIDQIIPKKYVELMEAEKLYGYNSSFGRILNPPLTPYVTSEVALLSFDVKIR